MAGFQRREVICYCCFTLGQRSSRSNSARRRLPSMDVFWLAPIMGLDRTTGAARATARSSAWFHPSPLPGLPAPTTASVVTPAIQGNCCRGRGGSVGKAGERSTKGECWGSRQVHGVLEGVPRTPCRVRDAFKIDIFPYLRPGGSECRWAHFVGNVLVQTIAHKTVWARN
jgi:hypothetical protein